MRLVCPNCAAQYEVDDSVIPDAGRDVQCSSCGQMWFQPGKAAMIEAARQSEAEEDVATEPDGWDIVGALEGEKATTQTAQVSVSVESIPVPEPAASAPVSAEPDTPAEVTASSVAAMIAALPADQAGFDDEGDEVPPLEPAPRPGAQPRRALDDSLLSILREEAEREARARRSEGTSLETQEELNLSAADTPAAVAPTRPAATTAPAPAEPTFDGIFAPEEMPSDEVDEREAQYGTDDDLAEVAVHSAGRSDRLPDIEEINSTLRATSDRSLGRTATIIRSDEPIERSGFRLGFGAVMGFALVILLLYSFAPQITDRVPSIAPALNSYVAAIDKGRFWLDRQAQVAIDRMQPKTAQP